MSNHRRWWCIASVQLASALIAGHACAHESQQTEADPFPEVYIKDHVVHYPITGTTAAQLRAQLENHGPKAAAPGHGRTRSEFQIASRLEPFDGGCQLAGAAVTLHTVITLPGWDRPSGAAAETGAAWAVSVALLQRHEAGHRTHAVEAARALRDIVRNLAPQRDCRRMQWAVDRAFQRVVMKLELRGNRYDARTGNGSRDDRLPGEARPR